MNNYNYYIGQKKVAKLLIKVFDRYSDKRILVLGTTCSGKSTIINTINEQLNSKLCRDMDSELFPQLSIDESDSVCSPNWTIDIGKSMHILMEKYIKTTPGQPLFSTDFIDCDIAILLKPSMTILKRHCALRDVDITNSINMGDAIYTEFYSRNNNIPGFVLHIY